MGYISDAATKQISDAFGRRLQKDGITKIQWIALYYLGKYKEISQRELSILMMVKDSSVGRLLDRMERDNLIIRTRSDVDRRITVITLSEQGLQCRKKLIPICEQFHHDLIDGITKEDINVYQSVISRMLYNVNKMA